MIFVDTTASILPARAVRVLDMKCPRLPLHAQLLEVGRLELDLVKSVGLSPAMQVSPGGGYHEGGVKGAKASMGTDS
jgi:hypothetical protein